LKLQIAFILVTMMVTLFLVSCAQQSYTPAVAPASSPQTAKQTTNEQATPQQANPQAPNAPPQQANPQGAQRYRNGNRTGFNRTQMNQVAQQACQGKNENDACQITFGTRTISGKCTSMNNTLICRGQRPANFSRPPPTS